MDELEGKLKDSTLAASAKNVIENEAVLSNIAIIGSSILYKKSCTIGKPAIKDTIFVDVVEEYRDHLKVDASTYKGRISHYLFEEIFKQLCCLGVDFPDKPPINFGFNVYPAKRKDNGYDYTYVLELIGDGKVIKRSEYNCEDKDSFYKTFLFDYGTAGGNNRSGSSYVINKV